MGRQADRLLELSRTDPLTGLRNRRVFEERLQEEIARARRYGQPLSLLFLDVDGLKAINDRGGHRAGDAALLRVASAIRRAARVTDVPARWGGDEFAVLTPDTGPEAASHLAQRIRALVGEPDGSEAITVSAGTATMAADEDVAAEQLCERADSALYAAKRRGRGGVASGVASG